MKIFEAAPGGSTQFTFNVSDKEDGRYAVILDRLDTLNPGVYEPRLYTPDPNWSTASGRDPDHRYLFWYGQYYASDLTEDLGSHTFDLALSPNVTPGDYLLETTLAGGFPSADMGWSNTQNFVLRVIPEPNAIVLVFVGAVLVGMSLLRKAQDATC